MSGKNFMSYGDADTILTEFSNDIKSRVSTKANQGLTAQQMANAKANIDIDKVPNVATNDQTPTFLEESTRTNIASGDKLSLIFGKIKKFFSDLKTVAFSGSYNDLSDTPDLSLKADKSLLEEGNDHFQFGVDANGNYGYHKTVGGADTVIPFKTVGTRSGAITANGTYTAKTDISKDGYESVTVSVPNSVQTKTVTAGTSNVTVTPDSGYIGMSSVTVQPTPSQSKSATPSTSAQTISPDSGKLLSSVSVSAIQTQTKSVTPSTSAQTVSPDSGKYLSSVSVGAISTQEKTVTAGTSAQNVTPDSGKFLSKVTVNPTPSQAKDTNVSHNNQTILPDSGKLLSQVIVWGKYTVNTLWTHSAASSYSGGTISIPNMKNYKYIVIYGIASTSNTGYKSILGGFDPNDVGTAYNPNNGYVNFTSHAVLRSYGSNDTIRLVNVGTNQITISDLIGFSGGDGKPFGSNMRYNTSARGNVIPTKIEGIIAI